jgi:hypothetical protein
MNSELKHFLYRYCGIAAIASISLGFFITLLVCNDIYYGCVGGWTWLSGLLVVAGASLLLFLVGLCLLIFKRELAAALVLSSVLLIGSYVMGLYVMEKATLIFYGERQYEEPVPESNERLDKPSQ